MFSCPDLAKKVAYLNFVYKKYSSHFPLESSKFYHCISRVHPKGVSHYSKYFCLKWPTSSQHVCVNTSHKWSLPNTCTHHFYPVADGAKFNSKSIGLSIQKKLYGKFSNKTVAKQFIDDDLSILLDTLHSILKAELDSKKADKVIKNMIKITVKIGLLYKNGIFNSEELALGVRFRKRLRKAALTVISFYEVDFTYDQAFLVTMVNECGDMLHKLVDRHLSDKSHTRINMVVSNFSNGVLLDKVFQSDGPYYHHLETISKGFHKVVDAEW